MDFNLNFSFLSATDLQKEKISHREITGVYRGDFNTIWKTVPMYANDGNVYYYLIGFSSKKRFLQLFIGCDGNTVYFFQVKVADLPEIIEDFCKKLK